MILGKIMMRTKRLHVRSDRGSVLVHQCVLGKGISLSTYSDSDEENGDVTMYQSMSPSLSSLKRGRQMPNTVVGISWPIGIAPGITFLAHIIAHILLMMMMRRKTTVMMVMMTMRRRTTVMIMVIAFWGNIIIQQCCSCCCYSLLSSATDFWNGMFFCTFGATESQNLRL